MTKYNHTVEFHNMESPRELVPIIMKLGSFSSVIDVGCGLGTFMRAFKESGVIDILGIDGKWCKKELLFQNIDSSEFIEQDLETKIEINRKFDLAISLEVAEHLTIHRAKSFVDDLCNLSDTIVFSAAIPHQGGDHHLNEQTLSYWINLFNNNNYKACDMIRPLIWNNKNIFWWYRQNIILFKKVNNGENLYNEMGGLIDVVHPDLFNTCMDAHEKNAVKRHMKLLFKSLLARIKL